MSLIFHKTTISSSATALANVLKTYEEYKEKIQYPENDEELLNAATDNITLLSGGITRVTVAAENLQAKVDKMEEHFNNTKKTDQKEMLVDIQEIEKDTHVFKLLAEAETFTHILESQLTDARMNLAKAQRRQKSSSASSTLEGISAQSIAESNSVRSEDNLNNEPTKIRSVRPPNVNLPTFSGDQEEFPEFWAMYESLIHENDEISKIEKTFYLKNSLRGKAEKSIKGIQPIAKNYDWMVKTLKEKFENQPANRSRIIQKLFDLKPATRSAKSCDDCLDYINSLVNQLVSTGYDIRTMSDPMWTETIIKKFPYGVVKDVLLNYQENKDLKISELLRLLEKEISSKLFVESQWGFAQENERDTLPKKASNCAFCSRTNHTSASCRTVSDIHKRREIAKNKKLCWKCLNNTHSSNQCSIPDCHLCGQKHHPCLCISSGHSSPSRTWQPPVDRRPRRNETQNHSAQPRRITGDNRFNNRPMNDARRMQPTSTQFVQAEQETNHSFHVNVPNENREQLVLMTAEGSLYNNNSHRYEKVLFFFDTGAQKTIIEDNTANDFGLPKLATETCVMSGIGGHIERFESSTVPLKIRSAYGKEINMTVQTKPIITNGFPSVNLTKADADYLELHEICLANSKFQGERQMPKILVGLDRYHDLVIEEGSSRRLPSGLRIAKTMFGAAIYGCGKVESAQNVPNISYGLTSIYENTDNQMLEKLFELEGLGIASDECSKDDKTEKYLEDYSKTISFENGYIKAPFPLKDTVNQLQDNYSIAIKRLVSLQKSLKSNNDQSFWYSKILSDYENQDIIERVYDADPDAAGIYYMPHSGVWRPHKKVPLRVVFDASSKKKGQLSLNDIIHKGESFVTKVHDILISSRFANILLLCDIEAAFTQIRIEDTHKDLCRFLWLKDLDKQPVRNNIIEYRFKRLPFGITASPSILNMAILTFLRMQNSKLSNEIARNLYVDNILLCANSESEALEKYRESKELFSKIGMNLREYVSNSELVNNSIPEIDRSDAGDIKLLGVCYNTKTDRFTVKTNFPIKLHLTKRDIVSQINSVYDPFGVAGPLLMKLKSLMREIFTSCQRWDDRIPPQLHKKWNAACTLVNNATISIQRPLLPAYPNLAEATLWLFADASKAAIATCAYLIQENGNVTDLISGKTKLAPKKHEQTIPKLELLGILIALRLGNAISQAANFAIKNIIVASDSEIALCWLKTDNKLPIFVANQRKRIENIKQSLETKNCVVRFYHVPTLFNPADAGTRGLTTDQISEHMWVTGPSWLNDKETRKRLTPITSLETRETLTEKPLLELPVTVIQSQIVEAENQAFDLTRFSKLNNALCTVARIGKLLHKWVKRTNARHAASITLQHINNFESNSEITANDIDMAKTLLLRDLHNSIDQAALQQRFKNLNVIRDDSGIIRHQSRLQNANLPLNARSPIYLPSKSYLTKLILRDVHESNAHCGKHQTLTIARLNYWIPRPSSVFKDAIGNCAICKRWQGLPFGAPQFPPLPKDRVTISRPFSNTACDFIGPFTSKDGVPMYVCLYTCLTIRAVHLETVENLSAGAFLNSFIRFCSRRGVPKLMRSDCGTNFKLGSKIIDLMFENDPNVGNSTMRYSAVNGIKWIFNPPASPWMGGVWERLVGSVKKCLRKSVGRKKLSFTDMCTALTRIEAIINSRPLTKLDAFNLDEIPLRPVDFLQGNLLYALPPAEILDSDTPYEPEFIQTVAQAKQALSSSEVIAAKFWECWNIDYLISLRESQKLHLNQKRHVSRQNPEVGEIVLIEEELLPRGCWSYGKIIENIVSNDGSIRSAKVLLPNKKVIHRPLTKIYPLEIRSCEDTHSLEIPQMESIHKDHIKKERPVREAKTKAYENLKALQKDYEKEESQLMADVHLTKSPQLNTTSLPRHQKSHTSNSILFSVLLALVTCSAVHASHPSIRCEVGQVTVTPPQHSFLLCFDNECKSFENYTSDISLKLPISPVNPKVRVIMKHETSNDILFISQVCDRPDFCLESSILFSKALLGNPHCWPVGALISIAMVTYLVGSSVLLIFWISTFLTRSKKRCISAVVNENTDQTVSMELQFSAFHGYRPTPLSGRVQVTLAIALIVLNGAGACQHGFTRHSTEMLCRPDGSCTYEVRRELLFNKLQDKHCIDILSGNKSVGLITVTLKSTQYTCVKASRYFTKDTEIQIFHSLRCAGMGSCSEAKCVFMHPNETVSELQASQEYPGYTACDHTCGGLLCGCLLPTPACLFYRIAHVPVSQDVYEIFTCQEWTPLVHVAIETQLFGKSKLTYQSLRPYVETQLNTLNVTVLTVQAPSHPLMNKKFAQSSHETIILPDLFQSSVECSTGYQATNEFHYCTNKVICSCSSGITPPHCQCPDNRIGRLRMDQANVLPLETAYLKVSNISHNVMVDTRDVEINIEVVSRLLANSSEYVIEDSCVVVSSEISGCYSCLHGAQITATCTSHYNSEALVNCPGHAFAIPCNHKGQKTNVSLDYDLSHIEEVCEVTCGKQSSVMEIRGRLLYHKIANVSVFWHNAKDTEETWMDLLNWHLPDMNPLLKTIVAHWKIALALAGTATALLGLTYLCGPAVILFFLKMLVALIKLAATPFLCLASIVRSYAATSHQ